MRNIEIIDFIFGGFPQNWQAAISSHEIKRRYWEESYEYLDRHI